MGITMRAKLAAAVAADEDVDAASKAAAPAAGAGAEEAAGPTFFVADTASDMWQVGVVAWLLLTGRPLFGGDTSDEQACDHRRSVVEELQLEASLTLPLFCIVQQHAEPGCC